MKGKEKINDEVRKVELISNMDGREKKGKLDMKGN